MKPSTSIETTKERAQKLLNLIDSAISHLEKAREHVSDPDNAVESDCDRAKVSMADAKWWMI